MICGFCATGQHAHCTGLLRASYAFCACADREHAAVVPASLPASQPCEFCPRTAWHLSTEDRGDGTRVFACGEGHLAIVAASASQEASCR